MKKIILAMPVFLLWGGCSHKTTVRQEPSSEAVETSIVIGRRPISGVKPSKTVLKASVFRMSGDYAGNVAVGVGLDGTLTYYPAPTDITAASAPVALGDGWWLNRQGIGAGARFTKYTFGEYSRLKEAPTPQEMLNAVIPGAVVTDFRVLDIPASEAMERLDEIKASL